MSENYFERITHSSRAHEQFNREWSIYSSLDFADIFLPYVHKYSASFLDIYDGAELFNEIPQTRKALYHHSPYELPANLIFYTFPKGKEADSKKERIVPKENEVAITASISTDLLVSVNFFLGENFRTFLARFSHQKKVSISKNHSLNLTKEEFSSQFSKGAVHFDIMRFVLNAIGFNQSEIMSVYRTALHYSDDGRGKFDVDGILTTNFDAGPQTHKNSWTHANIERFALIEGAGYNGREFELIYFGNWLRDLSSAIVGATQGLDVNTRKDVLNTLNAEKTNTNYTLDLLSKMEGKPTHDGWIALIELMAANEFVYERSDISEKGADFQYYLNEFRETYGKLDKETLGVYRPEEHIDNPKGLPDDSIFGDSILGGQKIEIIHELPEGKKIKQTLSRGETGTDKELEISDNKMKRYITEDTVFKSKSGKVLEVVPSSVKYFCQQIELAVEKGRNRNGFLHFGAALHVLEDYFAHTNFVELALIKNAKDLNDFTLDIVPWVELSDDVKTLTDGFEKSSAIPIVTGVFGENDMKASLYPKIEKLLLPIERARKVTIKAGDRTLTNHVIITVLQDYISQEKDISEDQKFRDPILGMTYEEILYNYEKLLRIDDTMIETGEAVSEVENSIIEWILDEEKARAYKRSKDDFSNYVKELASDYTIFRNFILRQIFFESPEEIKNNQTRTNKHYGSNPTHTQIAKDHGQHHFNHLAGLLAKHAVTDIAKMMTKSWAFQGEKDNNKALKEIFEAAKFKYFVHPVDSDWADNLIVKWAKKNHTKVLKGTREIVHIH